MKFTDKTILVTGGAGGIGKGLLRILLNKGPGLPSSILMRRKVKQRRKKSAKSLNVCL